MWLTADRLTAQPGTTNHTAQFTAIVGADGILVQQLPCVDGEGSIRGERDKIGVCPDLESALAAEANEVSGTP